MLNINKLRVVNYDERMQLQRKHTIKDLQTELNFMERVKELHYNNVLKFRQLSILDAERLAKIAQRKALYDTCKIISKIYDDAK